MASSSETSFGARLLRAKNLATFINNFSGYNPPRTEESVSGFNALIADIEAINTKESQQQQNYTTAVHLRQDAFKKKTGSIDKLLSPIKGAVDAQFGKNSTEAKAITSIVNTMRATTLIKAPADPNANKAAQSVSQSERSYGSMTQYFKDIISTLSQIAGYNPSNAALKVANLQTLAAQLDALNADVAKSIQPLQVSRNSRIQLYSELKDRAQRIKAYVKAEYGINSTEYSQVKGLNI